MTQSSMTHRLSVLHRPRRFSVRFLVTVAAAVLFGLASMPAWSASLVPLDSFGGGDGWLAPDDRSYLTTDNTQRGLAYNPTTGHLLLVNRAGGLSINILDGATGDDLGTLNQGTGVISGGTFLGNMIGVGDDGAIYMGNLILTTTTSTFKIYRWDSETATEPTVAYISGVDEPLAGARMGDTFDVIGSGTSTKLVAGYGSTPSVPGNNSYAVFDTADGQSFTATNIDIATSPPNAGDFRLGLTFTDSSHVLGSQGNSLYNYTSFSGSTGTLIASPAIPDPAGATADRLLNYNIVGGQPILAVQSTGDSHVSTYYAADPAAPAWLASGRNVVGNSPTNGNGTGELAWGATTVNEDGSVSQNLYGMSTNSGIQAFTFTLPSPPAVAGDYNKNGVVDAADYVLWRKTLNQPAVPAGTGADGDGNGTVGPEDFDYWRERFGNTSGSGLGSEAVPEPTTMMLVAAAVAGLLAARRRR